MPRKCVFMNTDDRRPVVTYLETAGEYATPISGKSTAAHRAKLLYRPRPRAQPRQSIELLLGVISLTPAANCVGWIRVKPCHLNCSMPPPHSSYARNSARAIGPSSHGGPLLEWTGKRTRILADHYGAL